MSQVSCETNNEYSSTDQNPNRSEHTPISGRSGIQEQLDPRDSLFAPSPENYNMRFRGERLRYADFNNTYIPRFLNHFDDQSKYFGRARSKSSRHWACTSRSSLICVIPAPTKRWATCRQNEEQKVFVAKENKALEGLQVGKINQICRFHEVLLYDSTNKAAC